MQCLSSTLRTPGCSHYLSAPASAELRGHDDIWLCVVQYPDTALTPCSIYNKVQMCMWPRAEPVQAECCSCGKWRQIPTAAELGVDDDFRVCTMQDLDTALTSSSMLIYRSICDQKLSSMSLCRWSAAPVANGARCLRLLSWVGTTTSGFAPCKILTRGAQTPRLALTTRWRAQTVRLSFPRAHDSCTAFCPGSDVAMQEDAKDDCAIACWACTCCPAAQSKLSCLICS